MLRVTRMMGGLLLAVACGLAHAEEPNGGTEGNLALGVGSRGIALGGAWLVGVGDASAVYWNPAGLSDLGRGDILLMHAPIGFGEAALSFVGVGYPTTSLGSFGIGYARLGTSGIAAYDADSNPLGELAFSESSFYLSYALRPRLPGCGTALALGITVKTLTQRLDPWSSTSGGLDAGLEYTPRRAPQFGLALVVRDAVAPRPQLDEEADPIPSTLHLAGSYRMRLGTETDLALHAGADHVSTLGWGPRVGVEATYKHRLQVRAGVSRLGAAFGIGVGWEQFGLDYTYLSRAESATHPVSVRGAWGSTLQERLDARSAERASELRAQLQSLLESRLAEAQAAYDRGDYAAALDEWKVVAGLDPSEERAERGIQSASARLAAAQAQSRADQSTAAARAAQFELGLRYYGASEYTLACNVWRELLAGDPENTEAARYLAKSEDALRTQVRQQAEQARQYEAQADWVSALAAWTRVRLADAKHPEVEPGVARCRTALERLSAPRAERTPAAAVAIKRAPGEAQYREALELYSAGEVERAVPLLREVQRLDPSNAAAAQLLAKADRQLQPLSPEDRARVRELYLHGMGYFTAGEYDKAIEDWSRILALDPGNTSVYQNIEEARARRREMRP